MLYLEQDAREAAVLALAKDIYARYVTTLHREWCNPSRYVEMAKREAETFFEEYSKI